ncbi:MAG: cytochrome c peroxidase [Elusimicrobiota bacterium]
MMRRALISALCGLLAVPAAAGDDPLATLRGHTAEVGAVIFLPDGKRILSASDDHTLKVWDAADGHELAAWSGHTAEVGAAAAAPDGGRVVSGSEDRTLRIWDAKTGKEIAVLKGSGGQYRVVELSADGRTAAALTYDGEIELWDLPTRTRRSLLDRKIPHTMDIAYSPREDKLVTANWDNALRLWDLSSGKLIARCAGHKNVVLTAAFSPDGSKVLSAGRDNTLRLWDATDCRPLAVWKGHDSYVYAAAFAPDGRTAVSGGADYTVRRWDTATGRELAVWRGHQGDIRAVAFSPDGTLVVSASDDRTLKLWRASPGPAFVQTPAAAAPPAAARPHDAEAALGRMLFFDRRLSGDNTVDCAVCHIPDRAYADGLALSIGYPDTLYFRNTPTLLNTAAQKYLYWDGRFTGGDLPSLIRDHIAEAHFMNADGRLVVEKLRQAPGYIAAFREVYGDEPTYGGVLNALAEFVRTLKSGPAPQALAGAAKRGRELFAGAGGCAGCHSGPLFTDGEFHDRDVPEHPGIFAQPLRRISFRRFFKLAGVKDYQNLKRDLGLYAVTKREGDRGKFRTPSLREAGRTAPYMHNGMLKTLADAVRHMNPRLSRRQVRDLTAFIKTLSSETVIHQAPALPGYAVRVREKRTPPSARPAGATAPAPDYPPLAPLPPVPVPEDNPLTPAKIELGKMLFFDPRLSGNGETYCGSCHEPPMGWDDDSDLAQGYEGTLHWRNSQTIINAAYYSKLNWDGDKPSLEEQARSAIMTNISGNGDPAMIEERLADSPRYVELFKKAFGVERPFFEGVLKAIASFERAVPISRNVPFDRGVLSPAARRGQALFENKAGCIRCHNGPLASDQGFHATGAPPNPAFDQVALRQVTLRYEHVIRGVPEKFYRDAGTDPGLFLTTLREEDSGKFRTPSLRELKYTAPYMHNGTLPTLADVLDFYDRGGGETPNKTPLLKPLGLTPGEKRDLIAFLESLSGDEILIALPVTPGHDDSRGYR